MRLRRQLDANGIARSDIPTLDNDGHDPRLSHQLAFVIATHYSGRQTSLITVQLSTRVPEPGHLDDGCIAQSQPRADRQSKQVNAAGGDIFTDISSCYYKACTLQVGKQLGVNKMDLAQIRQIMAQPQPGTMLNPPASMCVPLHPESGDEPDALPIHFPETVRCAAVHRHYPPCHPFPRISNAPVEQTHLLPLQTIRICGHSV